MASVLTIRKLPEEVQVALRERAAAAGRSVEAEARRILRPLASRVGPTTGGAAWPSAGVHARRNGWRSRAPSSSAKLEMHVDDVPARIVVDASVALKWVLDEEESDHAEALSEGRELLTSALLWAEAGNAIALRVRRGELGRTLAADALRDLRAAPLEPGRSMPMSQWRR